MANIHSLVVEELIDLLYELNDIHNLERDVECAHGEHFHHRLMKTIFHTGLAVEIISERTGTARTVNETVKSVLAFVENEGYVDKSDLKYATDKALTHIARMILAYEKELESEEIASLEIIKLCLNDIDFYIYG